MSGELAVAAANGTLSFVPANTVGIFAADSDVALDTGRPHIFDLVEFSGLTVSSGVPAGRHGSLQRGSVRRWFEFPV